MAVDTDEASLANPPLTSCRVVQFLTGPVLVCGPGVGDFGARRSREKEGRLIESLPQ